MSRSYVRDEDKAGASIDDDEFQAALVQALQKVNLTVTLESTLDEASRNEISTAVSEIRKGSKTPVRSPQFLINVETVFSVKDLPSYGELKIAVVNVTLRAIDLSSGEIAMVHYFEARGFGNEQSQARSNALKEAGRIIPAAFINQVVSRAGMSSNTSLGNGAKP